ncbi:hypothetical protein [Cypionkella sp. TWP1-2-1b2]|uniref:hypothetical protein n=1 Tax=Cypionkella sp. TWP1-2-1b2 TaxID=2804675 RepID=UPI003CE8FF1C
MLCNLVLRKPKTDITIIAGDLVATTTSNITYFLRDKTRAMQMRVEAIEQGFSKFWHWIAAKDDLAAAINE